jgi:hypothetical protein
VIQRMKSALLFFSAIAGIFVVSTSSQAQWNKRAIEQCGRVLGDWSPDETSDPASLIELYLSEYDLETPTGVDQAIQYVHGKLEAMQHKLEDLRELSPRALQQNGGRGTIRELDAQIRQVSVLAVILKNAKSTFLGHRVEH